MSAAHLRTGPLPSKMFANATCRKKRAYTSKREAKDTAKRINCALSPYLCPCGSWHLTSWKQVDGIPVRPGFSE